MLAGEYSVLTGGPALAATVSSKLESIVSSQTHFDGIIIESDIWPEALRTSWSEIDQMRSEPSIHIFSTLINNKLLDLRKINGGFKVKINSDKFDISFGIGSSSAIRVSIIQAISELEKLKLKAKEICKLAFDDQLKCQGKASGYDIITQVHGGLIESNPFQNSTWGNNFKTFPIDLSFFEKLNI